MSVLQNAGLAQMPLETLDLIISCLRSSQSVINLWKCGSKNLNYRIMHGGCRIIDLEDVKRNSTSRFPKMILSLQKLRSLRINRGEEVLAGAFELRDLLLQLSPTLESLNLTCREAESCWFLHPQLSPKHGCFPTSSATPAHLLPYIQPEVVLDSPLWEIEAKFPNLKSLSISAAAKSIIDVYCEYLPSTLTDLTIGTLCKDFSPVSALKIPKNVVSLKMNLSSVPDLSLLPPTLTRFNTFKSLMVDALFLPKSLTETNIAFPFVSDFCWRPPRWTPRGDRSEQLSDSMDLDDPSSLSERPWIEFLPRQLLKLFVESDFDGAYLLSLPRNITNLKIHKLDWETVTDVTCFPPNLTKLQVLVGEFTSSDMLKLPKGLTQLKVPYYAGCDVSACISAMPQGLKKLTIRLVSFLIGIQRPTTFPKLPPTLTHWSCPHLVPFKNPTPTAEFLPPTLDIIDIRWENVLCSAMPRMLRIFFTHQMDPDQFCQLPRHLEDLATKVTKMLTKEHLEGLPRSLKRFHLLGTTKASEEMDLFSTLPDSLEELSLGYSCQKVKIEMFGHLPKRLKYLTCSVVTVKDEIFELLPRTLQEIQLEWQHDATTEMGVAFVPPFLSFQSGIRRQCTLERSMKHKPQPVISPDPRVLITI